MRTSGLSSRRARLGVKKPMLEAAPGFDFVARFRRA